jgi:hypothetical protein
MAMLSVALVSALRTGLLVWDKGNNHLNDLRRSGLVVQLLGDSIGGALPFNYTIRNGNVPFRKLAFDASSDGLRFVSRNSFKDGPNSLPRWIEIRWIRNSRGPGGALMAEERSIVPPDNLPRASVEWTGQLLQADSCSFDFLQTAVGNRAPLWTPDWRPVGEQLPAAVRLRCVRESKPIATVIPLDYAVSYAAGLRLN